jgi:hypothetical protein
MEVVILQVFVSLVLVVGSILLFAFTCHERSFDHADRLALLPLDRSGDPRPLPVRAPPTQKPEVS